MLRRRLCEATLQWTLRCEGPLLVADGRWDEDRDRRKSKNEDLTGIPNKVFLSRNPLDRVRNAMTKDEPQTGLSFFVPGTSLRGPLRAQAERIVRSVLPEDAEVGKTACDPFMALEEAEGEGEEGEASSAGEAEGASSKEPGTAAPQEARAWQSCSQRLKDVKVEVPYAHVCPACKLFGCTATASRIEVGDAPVAGGPEGLLSLYRDMIGIDRFTAGVHSGAKFRFHVLENTVLTTTVRLRNFELWQLGLLAFAFRDFEEERVAIGFGKTKGFGRVKGKVESVELAYPRGRSKGTVEHLGSLASEEEIKGYRLRPDVALTCDLEEVTGGGFDLYSRYRVKDLPAFWSGAAAAFTAYVDEAARV